MEIMVISSLNHNQMLKFSLNFRTKKSVKIRRLPFTCLNVYLTYDNERVHPKQKLFGFIIKEKGADLVAI